MRRQHKLQRRPKWMEKSASPANLRQALLLGPSLVLLGVFFFAPLAILLRYSFNRFIPGGGREETFTVENYTRFMFDSFYSGIMLRTFAMGIGVMLLTLIMGYPLAYLLARSRSKWNGILLTIILIPFMMSVVVRTYGWTVILANSGIINRTLEAVGLPKIKLLFTMTGTVLSLTQLLMPFMVLTLVGVLQNISRDLEEAARGLGAGHWHVFWNILLPLSMPGIAAGSFLVFALSISAFATPRLIGGASLQVMATMVYDQVLTNLNWPFAAATSFILLVVVLAMTVAQTRLLRRQPGSR
jgi:putative spermidine/putrescine transport system permease protein